jgi:hypothetical protein
MLGERSSLRVLAMVSMLALGSGCEEEDRDGPAPARESAQRDHGDIQIAWESPPDAISKSITESFHETQLFEDVAEGLNDTLKFPRNLPVRHVSCGEENAFYDPQSGELLMCYELLSAVAELAYDPTISEEEIGKRLVGTWMFVFFHELGHGLIDMYGLPVTGKEEDAVDDFSAVLLIEAGLADFAIRAAEYWSVTDQGMYDESSFADEHSLNSQRFFNILCAVYGSNPRQYQGLVTGGYLPEARAERCPAEYQQKLRSWETLLEPWTK